MEIGGPVVACVADLAFKYAGEISFLCIEILVLQLLDLMV